MATVLTKYNQISELLSNGLIDLGSDSIKLSLVTSAYTVDAEHDEFADASAAELVDASYTAGGVALTGQTLTRSAAVTTFDATDLSFPALSGTFRYGIGYAVGTFGTYTNPVLFYVLFDDTPGDIVSTGLDFDVQWNASGILTIT